MRITRGMILAAGLGQRMHPITLKTPKSLIELGKKNLLERSIDLLINHGVKEIVINVHYLADQIRNFVHKKNFKAKIFISDETNLLLDTGGGILEGTSMFNKEPFVVINPDTLWDRNYSHDLKNLEKLYFKERKPCLLVVKKNLSFDTSFKGDFNLNGQLITKDNTNQYIFTGLQILDRSVFVPFSLEKVFSMNKVWNELILNKNLLGIPSVKDFYHLNSKKMYDKISKLKIID